MTAIRTVPYTPRGCVLHKTHRPTPARLEKHHVLPLYLAKRIGVTSTEIALTCPTGHDDIHVALNAMLVGAPMPRGIGVEERRYARKALALFMTGGGTASALAPRKIGGRHDD